MSNGTITPKNWLETENDRNVAAQQLFHDMICQAFGPKWVTLIGHHLAYQCTDIPNSQGEIPAADSLIFDHDIMGVIFKDDAQKIMSELVALPAEEREAYLSDQYYNHGYADANPFGTTAYEKADIEIAEGVCGEGACGADGEGSCGGNTDPA